MEGFFILEPPLPFWRLCVKVLGVVLIAAVVKAVSRFKSIRYYPYREWILHIIWALVMIWLRLFMLHERLLYTWQWSCISWYMVDVLWIIERRNIWMKYYSKRTLLLRILYTCVYIAVLIYIHTPFIIFTSQFIAIAISLCMLILV